MRNPGRHTVTLTPADVVPRSSVPVPSDALTDPSNDSLIGAALTLWPQGAAWGTPDGIAMDRGSTLARFTRVLLDPFVKLYRLAFLLARESSVDGVDQLLTEWETDYGLPDICETEAQTVEQRLAALASKVLSVRIITPEDFVRLALDQGFEVAIEEPAIFGCGHSECGGEHECGAAREEVYFIIRVRDLFISYFRVSESEAGHDRLFDYGGSQKLICLFQRIAPGWTIPVLGEWRDFSDEDPASGPVIYGGTGFQLN